MLILMSSDFGLLTRLRFFIAYDVPTQKYLINYHELFKKDYMSRILMRFVVRLFSVISIGLMLAQAQAKPETVEELQHTVHSEPSF